MAGKEQLMIWLGNRIRAAREQAGLTQDKLAELVGVSRTAVARWENGDIEPKLKNLIILSKQLHVSTDYLLGLEEKTWIDKLELSEDARQALEIFVKAIRIKQEVE